MIWNQPAFLFSPYDGFGVAKDSLRDAADSCSDSFLAITSDGQHGIHREEDLHDTQVLVALPRAAA